MTTPIEIDPAIVEVAADGDPATGCVEELLHTLPFYVMEVMRKRWIEIVDRHIQAAAPLLVAGEREACAKYHDEMTETFGKALADEHRKKKADGLVRLIEWHEDSAAAIRQRGKQT